MNYTEINEALRALAETSARLEEAYELNGGEVTDETEAIEADKEAVARLLQEDGIDSLGRWLKAKLDEKETWKAEKAAADRKMKAIDNTVDFIKSKISEVLRATGIEKAKGNFYSFTQATSTKTSVRTDKLDEEYLEAATEAARNAGLPPYVDVELKTSVKRIQEYAEYNDGDGLNWIVSESSPSVRFTKPAKGKEE